MRYDFLCSGKCKKVIEIEKKMADPDPVKCPFCNSKKFSRQYTADFSVMHAGRPIWTYNDVKKYKTFRQNGGPLQKVDPAKHGDLGAMHADSQPAPEPKKKKKKKKNEPV